MHQLMEDVLKPFAPKGDRWPGEAAADAYRDALNAKSNDPSYKFGAAIALLETICGKFPEVEKMVMERAASMQGERHD